MTHQDNKAILAAVFAQTAEGNWRPFVESLADDVRWTIIGSTAWSRTYVGKSSVINDLLRPLGRQLGGAGFTKANHFVAEGNDVVVQATGHNTTVSGKKYENSYCWVIRMRDGKMSELTEYADTQLIASALEDPHEGALMSDVIPEVTTETLQAFADAWNRHDVDALMSFMTEDCVFEASAGPDVCGARYVGQQAVRAAFAEVWTTTFPDAHWGDARHFVCGDRGVSEWTFTGTRGDGTRVEVQGCDLFTFVGGKIALKNSYRKNRPALGPAPR